MTRAYECMKISEYPPPPPWGAHRPALGAFLRDIDGKIARIPQCRALGTTLQTLIKCCCGVLIFLLTGPNLDPNRLTLSVPERIFRKS